MLTSLGCKNLIDINTRFVANSRSTLDHVLTNIDKDQTVSGVLNFPITDHLPVFALIRNQANTRKKIDKENKYSGDLSMIGKKENF